MIPRIWLDNEPDGPDDSHAFLLSKEGEQPYATTYPDVAAAYEKLGWHVRNLEGVRLCGSDGDTEL